MFTHSETVTCYRLMNGDRLQVFQKLQVAASKDYLKDVVAWMRARIAVV